MHAGVSIVRSLGLAKVDPVHINYYRFVIIEVVSIVAKINGELCMHKIIIMKQTMQKHILSRVK